MTATSLCQVINSTQPRALIFSSVFCFIVLDYTAKLDSRKIGKIKHFYSQNLRAVWLQKPVFRFDKQRE